jgi:hypothetical protein
LNMRHSSIRIRDANEPTTLAYTRCAAQIQAHGVAGRRARKKKAARILTASRLAGCGLQTLWLYGLQIPAKAWQYIPFSQVTFPGPQAHVAAAARSVSHGESFCMCMCPLAWANPTDIPIASTTTAKVLSIVPSPDLLEGHRDWRPRLQQGSVTAFLVGIHAKLTRYCPRRSV